MLLVNTIMGRKPKKINQRGQRQIDPNDTREKLPFDSKRPKKIFIIIAHMRLFHQCSNKRTISECMKDVSNEAAHKIKEFAKSNQSFDN